MLCNFAAGLLLSIFTLLLALNDHVARRVSTGSPSLQITLWVLGPFIGYVFLASILFFALSFLTTIPSTPTSFRLEPALNGYYVTGQPCSDSKSQPKNACEANSQRPRPQDMFAILGSFDGADNGEVEFIGGGEGLTFQWSKNISGAVSGALWIMQGCVAKDAIADAMQSKPIFRGALKSLRITLDEGLSEVRSIDFPSKDIRVSDDNIAQFWITPSSKDSERLQVTRFLGKGVVRMPDRLDSTVFELGLFATNDDKSGPTFRQRRVRYTINEGDTQTLEIAVAPTLISPQAAMTCAHLPTRATANGLSASANAPYVSLVIATEPPSFVELEEVGRSNEVAISGANGWIKSTGYRKADLHEAVTAGSLSQISLLGVVKDLTIDGQSVATGATSTLQVSGDLEGRTDGPALLLEGSADYLILNGKRLTTTRWERLDAGIRIPIILGVPTAAYFLLNFAIAVLRRPNRRVWRPPGARGKRRKSNFRH